MPSEEVFPIVADLACILPDPNVAVSYPASVTPPRGTSDPTSFPGRQPAAHCDTRRLPITGR
jgi:hypothetical protein